MPFQKRLKIPADVKAGENRIRIWVGFTGNYEKIEKLKVSDDRVADQMVSLFKSRQRLSNRVYFNLFSGSY